MCVCIVSIRPVKDVWGLINTIKTQTPDLIQFVLYISERLYPINKINKSSCIKTAILKMSLQIKSPGLDHVTNYQSEYSTSTTKKQWANSERLNSTNSI